MISNTNPEIDYEIYKTEQKLRKQAAESLYSLYNSFGNNKSEETNKGESKKNVH